MNARIVALATLTAAVCSPQAINENRQLARDIFRELIEINTTDSAGDTTAAARAFARRFVDAGFPAADVHVLVPPGKPKRGNLVVRYHGRADSTLKPIVLLGHLDVVEAKREDWTTDPFKLVEKDGFFYGRGTQDIKQGDAIEVATLLRFNREKFVPSRDLILALTAGEESGVDNGVDWLLKTHPDLITGEYVLNYDAGGVYTEKGKPVSVEIGAAEKIYADLQTSATNPGGHSSQPRPDNAIYELTDALERLKQAPFPEELNPVTRAYFEKVPPVPGDPRDNSLRHTTCTPTRLAAGHANNALPQSAMAIVNCRILPGHSPEEVRRRLVEILNAPKLQVRYFESASGNYLDGAPDQKGSAPSLPPQSMLKPFERVADEFWPGAPVVIAMQTGASDGKYFAARGVPSYGIGEVAIGKDDNRAHGKDERLGIDAFYQGLDFYYRFLKLLLS